MLNNELYMITEEMLENLILGHIAIELKDEIEVGRQVNLAKKIMQALRIQDVVGRSELLKAFQGWQLDKGYLNHKSIKNGMVDEYLNGL